MSKVTEEQREAQLQARAREALEIVREKFRNNLGAPYIGDIVGPEDSLQFTAAMRDGFTVQIKGLIDHVERIINSCITITTPKGRTHNFKNVSVLAALRAAGVDVTDIRSDKQRQAENFKALLAGLAARGSARRGGC